MKIIINGEVVEVGGGGGSEDVYSTEETRIGTWIDGKPVYRKTWVGTSPNISETKAFDLGFSIDTLVNSSGSALRTDGKIMPLHFANGVSYFAIIIKRDTNELYTSYGHNAFINTSYWITLEYTKTTDEPTAS